MSQKLTKKELGKQCTRVALIDFDRFKGAMTCIVKMSDEAFANQIKANYAFRVIPVFLPESMSSKAEFAQKRMAAVDAERAERFFAFVRANAKPELLELLKANYELDLYPIDLDSKTSGWREFIIKSLRLIGGVTLMLAVLYSLTGCAESSVKKVESVAQQEVVKPQGQLYVEEFGIVQSVKVHRDQKTRKKTNFHDVKTDLMELSKINQRRFSGEIIRVGDVLSKTVFLTDEMAEIQLCKNGDDCKLFSVCYRFMQCFGKYQALRETAERAQG